MSGQYFGEARNVERSTTEYIKTQIESGWTGVSVVLGYPNFSKASTPVVSVTLSAEFGNAKEIGSTAYESIYNILIEIFASDDGQRLDLSQFIKEKVISQWTYYLYSRGSGNTIDRVANGNINFIEFTQNSRIDFFDDVSVQDRFRHIIGINVRVDNA